MNTSQSTLGTLIETDVLVIGSGASGCGAALGAQAQGQRVLIMDKGKLESSGCLGGGNDHYMAILEEDSEFDGADDLIKFYAKPLNGWTPTMLREGWFAHMKPLLLMLEKAGVQFGKDAQNRFVRTQGFGQPGKWWCHIANGMIIKRVLGRVVREHAIDVLDHVMAVKILTDGGKACGAVGWNVLTGEFCTIRAKTVVSAQGRSATRGTNNSTHNPFNVWMYPYNTSAGVVLGYEAGAAVTELDTYQRATMLPKGYGCPGMNGINSSGAHELNAMGERFMGKYDRMWENGVRNNQIQGTFTEQMEGSGPPFYMDMRHVPEEVVKELQYILMPGDKATFGDWAECTGTDFQHKMLEVEIGELIFGGTVAVNDHFETSLPNLFCGSIFLYCSGALCGGYEAGRQAAMRAAGMDSMGQIDADSIAAARTAAFAPLNSKGDISWQELEGTARNVMNYYMGFRRSMAGMERALEKIRFLSAQASRLHAGDLRELMRCREAQDVLNVCELAILATMQRKESGRCVYRLTDYPELNPDMAKPLLLRKSADGPEYFWGKAPLL
ncbi:MAG: FAD-binding protein [Desulfovibrionaceae bacterium]|nr:FAD-binding protein [Desulfovibrionaceae bacterium]